MSVELGKGVRGRFRDGEEEVAPHGKPAAPAMRLERASPFRGLRFLCSTFGTGIPLGIAFTIDGYPRTDSCRNPDSDCDL